MLTPEQIIARDGKLTASRVASLMNGDKDAIMLLWQEMVGDPGFVPEDLSGVWPVQLGSITETLNLDWYERKQGRKVTRRGEVVVHPEHEWAAATLDGYDDVLGGPIETKHVGGWEKTEVIVQRYMPQVQWQMEVTKSEKAALSIIAGAAEPYVEIIRIDRNYVGEMLARAHRFMQKVWLMEVPVLIEAPKLLVPQSAMKDYNFTGNNLYAAMATQWIANKAASSVFKEAEKALKELVPPDGKSIYGHYIKVVRSKSGSLSIKPL